MTTLLFTTNINAPIDFVFDLSRNIDIHVHTMKHSKERVISGRRHGLLNLGEPVKWKGKHLGFTLEHESIITTLIQPNYFVDEMIEGQFKWFKHQHIFKTINNKTMMIDKIEYLVPYSIIGWIIDSLLIKHYLKRIIRQRNINIKRISEQCHS